jgi:hypothetical protein
LSWSHTCTGSNLVLVVGIAIGIIGDAGKSASATYNGVSMTSAGIVHSDNATDGFVQMFYLAAPATGANTVAITVTGGTVDITGGSVSFTGAHQTTPLINIATNFGASATASVSVTNASGNMVVDALCDGAGVNTGSGTTERWHKDFNSSSAAGNAAQSTSSSTGTVNMTYDLNSDSWGIIGASVQSAPVTPTVTTDSVTNVGGTTATGNGTVVSDGGSTITERGFCWSTSANPTTSDSKATAAGTTGSYSASLTGLSNNTTYHTRAYAINANGTSYGADTVFTVYNVALSWIRA